MTGPGTSRGGGKRCTSYPVADVTINIISVARAANLWGPCAICSAHAAALRGRYRAGYTVRSEIARRGGWKLDETAVGTEIIPG